MTGGAGPPALPIWRRKGVVALVAAALLLSLVAAGCASSASAGARSGAHPATWSSSVGNVPSETTDTRCEDVLPGVWPTR
jgi:hypothetical protein